MMAAEYEVKDGECLEVCTELPDIDEPKTSPVFLFMGNMWSIRFVRSSQFSYYNAYIELKNNATVLKPFAFEFRIGFKNEKNLSLEKGNGKMRSGIRMYRFWEMEHSVFHSKLPPDYQAGNIVKFWFRFYFPREPTLQIKSLDKCVQTVSYLNAEVSLESLSKNFAQLLDSGLNYDVEVKCEEQSVKAHKIVLSARSEVFKAMFQSGMLEERTGIVQIPDIDASCIQDFVRYLYTAAIPKLTFEKAKALYEVGDKYAVSTLMLQCSEYLQDNLSLENVCQCLALADAHSDQKLKDRIITHILDRGIYHLDEFWLPFCENYPKIANEVYRLSHKKFCK